MSDFTFKAYPVNGDSFLLEYDNNNSDELDAPKKSRILVDGGYDKSIVEFLNSDNIDKLNVIVCTHYDRDHFGGIKAILDNSDFDFDELWLPEDFLSIQKTYYENPRKSIIDILYGIAKSNLEKINDGDTSNNISENDIKERDQNIDGALTCICYKLSQLKRLNDNLDVHDDKEIHDLYYNCIRQCNDELKSFPVECFFDCFIFPLLKHYEILEDNKSQIKYIKRYIKRCSTCIEIHNKDFRYFKFLSFYNETKEVFEMLLNTLEFTSKALKSKKVKWLKYEKKDLKNEVLGFNIYGLNCVVVNENDILCVKGDLLSFLTLKNKKSLVFKYIEDDNTPNILFSADSDFSFTGDISLNVNSIITAPHHGSISNDKAYNKIICNNPIYVRGDYSRVEKIGTFHMQNIKYCTKCKNTGEKQIIIIKNINEKNEIFGIKCK